MGSDGCLEAGQRNAGKLPGEGFALGFVLHVILLIYLYAAFVRAGGSGCLLGFLGSCFGDSITDGGSPFTGSGRTCWRSLTIKQNMRKVFHSLASPRVKLSSEFCHFAWFPLCPRTFCFPVLC